MTRFTDPEKSLINKVDNYWRHKAVDYLCFLGMAFEGLEEMELILAILVVLAIHVGVPTVIGFVIVGILAWCERSVAHQKRRRQLVCTVNADCPLGYICVNGCCVPAR